MNVSNIRILSAEPEPATVISVGKHDSRLTSCRHRITPLFTCLALTHSSLCISSECLPNSRIPQHRAGRSSLALRPRLYSKSHPSLSRNISFSFSPTSSISDTWDESCPLSTSRVSVIILLVSLLLTNFLQHVF